MKSDGPVRQYGMRKTQSSVTALIHEEDVFVIRDGIFRLDVLVQELEAQGWEVKNG